MKIVKGSQGFTFSEVLLAMSIALSCCTLLVMMANWMTKAICVQSYLVQDQMAILQLRLDIAQCEDWKVEDDRLVATQEGDTIYYEFHSHRLVKRPGYEIFMEHVDRGIFLQEGDVLYLQWQKDGDIWQAKLEG